MKIMGLGIYLGIGAMLHALFVGPHFDWTSAWTFGWLFGWPIVLFVSSWAALLIALIVSGLIWAGYVWIDTFAKWNDARKRRKRLRTTRPSA